MRIVSESDVLGRRIDDGRSVVSDRQASEGRINGGHSVAPR
jgi:hypothetical protein